METSDIQALGLMASLVGANLGEVDKAMMGNPAAGPARRIDPQAIVRNAAIANGMLSPNGQPIQQPQQYQVPQYQQPQNIPIRDSQPYVPPQPIPFLPVTNPQPVQPLPQQMVPPVQPPVWGELLEVLVVISETLKEMAVADKKIASDNAKLIEILTNVPTKKK